jgi:adenosine/AMP kinase
MIEIKSVRMEFPADANVIVGQSHFIKTVEELKDRTTSRGGMIYCARSVQALAAY